jgi:hypothetical protein
VLRKREKAAKHAEWLARLPNYRRSLSYTLSSFQPGKQATHTDIAAKAEKYAEALAQLPQSQGASAYTLSSPPPAKKATLTDIATKARSLMQVNDPDAVRAGLAEIADAIDAISGTAEQAEAA